MIKLSDDYDGMVWSTAPFVSIDTETTGFSKEDRICEIALLMIQGDKILDKFHTLVNPEREMNEGARNVHGISDEQLVDAPKFGEIKHRVLEFLGRGAPWVAHQLMFDARMLSYGITKEEWPRGIPTLCSLEFAKKHHTTLRLAQSHKLLNLAGYLQIPYRMSDAHNAMVDAELLGKIVPKMMGDREVARTYTKCSEEWLK